MTLQVPREYNTRDFYIGLCWLEDPSKPRSEYQFVKVISDENPILKYGSFDEWMMEQVPALWLDKYGENVKEIAVYTPFEIMPDENQPRIESGWAETTSLTAFHEDGPTRFLSQNILTSKPVKWVLMSAIRSTG